MLYHSALNTAMERKQKIKDRKDGTPNGCDASKAQPQHPSPAMGKALELFSPSAEGKPSPSLPPRPFCWHKPKAGASGAAVPVPRW